MTKFVVLNTVCKDGLGDFSHFEDIITALRTNPIFQPVEFTAIVYFETRIYRGNVIYHSGNTLEDASFLYSDEFKNTSIGKLEIFLG